MTPTPLTTVGLPRAAGASARSPNSRTPPPSSTAARSTLSSSSRPRFEELLDRFGPVHRDGLRAGGRLRLGNSALDAVGDEMNRRAGPRPAVGHVVGDDEGGHIPRVLAAPAVGDLERAPAGEEGADLGHQPPQVLGARRRDAEREVGCRDRHRDLDVAREVPVEHFGDPVVRVGDVAVEGHRHRARSPWSWRSSFRSQRGARSRHHRSHVHRDAAHRAADRRTDLGRAR